jgi:hypothetical protein
VMESVQPFGLALRELLVEHDYVSASGAPKWSVFAAELEDAHYETLLRAVSGKRSPSPHLMEEAARALRIRPEYFLEYRIYLAQREFDPRVVGLERAAENVALWRHARGLASMPPDH